MCDIFEERAKCWRERLKWRFDKSGLSINKFIETYNDRFCQNEKPINRNTFYRWRNVGNLSKTGQIIGFPKYENMLRIAQFFDVDVGYLTGETNAKKFDIGKASEVLQLDSEAVEVIMKLTGAGEWGDTKEEAKIKERYEWFDKESDNFKTMFTLMLKSKHFLDIMTSLADLKKKYDLETFLKENKLKENFEAELLEKTYAFIDLVFESDEEDSDDDNIANLKDIVLQQQIEPIVRQTPQNNKKIIKFGLIENVILLLDEIFPEDD